MELTVSELDNIQKYQLLYELDHQQIAQFAQQELKKRNVVTIFYFVFNIISFAFLGAKATLDITKGIISWDMVLSGLGMGVLLCFVVVIFIHELLHVLAYKLTGAQTTAIQANWKQLVFVAVADKFIANAKEFLFIALLPFSVISTVLLIGLYFLVGFWFYVTLGALLMHSAACGGDFALVSFLWESRRKRIITYDDVPEKKSYFYEIL